MAASSGRIVTASTAHLAPAGSTGQAVRANPRPGRSREHQTGATGVVGAQKFDGMNSHARRTHHDRLAQRPQCRRDSDFIAGLDPQEGGDSLDSPVHLVTARTEQGTRAVAPLQAEGEGIAPRSPGRFVALGGAFGLAELLDEFGYLGASCRSGFEAGIKIDFALVECADAALGGVELRLVCLGAVARLGAGSCQPLHLIGRSGGAGPHDLDLPGELGKPLAAIGGRAGSGDELALGGDQFLFERLPMGDRSSQRFGTRSNLGRQLGLLLGEPGSVGIEGIGIATHADVVEWRSEVAGSLGSEPRSAAEPFGQCRESVPGLLGAGEHRGIGSQRRIERRLPLEHARQLLLHVRAPGADRRLVRDLAIHGDAERLQIVCQQSELRIAQVGLDRRRAASDLGLFAQRLELAAQFTSEVGEPGEVRLHGLKLAKRLLLALAVLEDTGGFLDETPPVLRARVQDRVELALADDHVHLAADARVAEQLLNVEQPGGVAVDLVLAGAVAEHPPGDRHLGVVDRQCAVGVVDRQGHLGATEGRATGRSGENDVFHLAAAQRLRALLPEHPRDRVHDIALAGPVRPDDTRDTRLEPERRCRRKGLEAL